MRACVRACTASAKHAACRCLQFEQAALEVLERHHVEDEQQAQDELAPVGVQVGWRAQGQCRWRANAARRAAPSVAPCGPLPRGCRELQWLLSGGAHRRTCCTGARCGAPRLTHAPARVPGRCRSCCTARRPSRRAAHAPSGTWRCVSGAPSALAQALAPASAHNQPARCAPCGANMLRGRACAVALASRARRRSA